MFLFVCSRGQSNCDFYVSESSGCIMHFLSHEYVYDHIVNNLNIFVIFRLTITFINCLKHQFVQEILK